MIRNVILFVVISVNSFGQVPSFFDSTKIPRLHNRGITGIKPDGSPVRIASIGTGCNFDTSITNISYFDFTGQGTNDSMSHNSPMIHAGAARYIGIAPGVHVYSLKIYNTNARPFCTFQTMINALQFCLDSSIDIVTNSISIGTYAQLNAKMTQCWNAGITLFMSAGNNPGTNVIQPAQCDSVIAVGARDFTLGFFNSYLTSHNKVTLSGTNEGQVGGTSQAASTFAFMACLIKQRFPDMTPLQIKVSLQQVCTPWLPPYNNTYTTSEGIGASNLIGAGYFNTWIY